MNNKDREAFEVHCNSEAVGAIRLPIERNSPPFDTNEYAKKDTQIAWLAWQAALDYARKEQVTIKSDNTQTLYTALATIKEQRELLKKIATVLKAIPEREYPCKGEDINCSGCKHVRDAEEILAEINAAGIGGENET